MFSVLLVAFLSVLILYYLCTEYGTKITRFPIIGSFHMLFTNPKPLIEQIQYDRHKYGDITYFKLINIDLGKILSLITLMATCSSFSISKQHKIDKTDGWDGPVCWEVIVYGKIQISRWEEERSFGSRSKTLVNFISSKIEPEHPRVSTPRSRRRRQRLQCRNNGCNVYFTAEGRREQHEVVCRYRNRTTSQSQVNEHSSFFSELMHLSLNKQAGKEKKNFYFFTFETVSFSLRISRDSSLTNTNVHLSVRYKYLAIFGYLFLAQL